MIKRISSYSLPIDEEYTFSLTARLNYSEDVKSIDSIVNAYYTIVSDSNHQALDFERLKFLHLNTALIVKMDDMVDSYFDHTHGNNNLDLLKRLLTVTSYL